MKILINTPNINAIGGVSNHYLGLKYYWTENVLYNSIGSRRWRKYFFMFYVLKFIFRLFLFNPDIVLLNPSLGPHALMRDFVYLNIAKFFGFKVAIFFHGFDIKYAKSADWKWITNNINKASCVIVLADLFKEILFEKGVKISIYLSTTKVDNKLLDNFNIERVRTGRINNLLFLSRIEKEKGVYEVADSFNILKKKYKHLKLTFVGDGSELRALKKYISDNNIDGVEFTGNLRDKALVEKYISADFFIFPSHGEGMPTVVLEAMAFGLPVLTRYVGGLSDFFENWKMGYITNSNNPAEFASIMEEFINNQSLTKQISFYNYNFAKEHFMASKVAINIENILRDLL